MIDPVLFAQYLGKTVTLILPTLSITGNLKDITADFVVLENSSSDGVEIQYVLAGQILAIRVLTEGERPMPE